VRHALQPASSIDFQTNNYWQPAHSGCQFYELPDDVVSASAFLVGGVAQWLRLGSCRSLVGGLSLPCSRPMVDWWPLCG